MFSYRVIDSLEEVRHLATNLETFCDIETQGLYINTRLVQIYQPATDPMIYILDTDIIALQDIKDYIKPMWTIWYNCSYDFGTLNMTTDRFDDIFYLVRSAYPQYMEFSLDKVIVRMGHGGLYEGLDKKALQKQGFVLGAYLSVTQLKYSATDVYALALMWKDKNIQKARDILAYRVDMYSMKYAIVYQQNGIVVNQKIREEKERLEEDIINELTPKLPIGFNPNSYVQVRKLLMTKNSDHSALIRIALQGGERGEYAQTIIDLKRAKKGYSYLRGIDTDKMYTRYNVAGAITGRFTSSGGDMPYGFNSQQIPRPYQMIFQTDTEDTAVVHLDYSTLELRIACAVFGEEEMYKQLKRGEDLHTSMAVTVTGKPLAEGGKPIGSDFMAIGVIDTTSKYITKKDRQDAKSVNFGFVFGMSSTRYVEYAYTQFGIVVTEERAKAIRDKYFSKYPGFKRYHAMVWNNYKDPAYIYKTALGRRVKPKLGTDGINGPVQGSGAETTKLAVHYLCTEHPEALGLIYNVVHDAIYLRVPKADKEIWVKRTQKAMLKGWSEISKTSLFKYKDIPIAAEE